jgi:DNA polymerase III subunit epsilon
MPLQRTSSFTAIDFETADPQADSACAIGLVRVEQGKVVRREHLMIRPPRSHVMFTEIHGIRWNDVKDMPSFAERWPVIREMLDGVEFLAAHNASFDKRVLLGCCAVSGIVAPLTPFVCTVKMAREAWSLYPTKLPDVCRHLGIQLKHHEALSDAEACAAIVLAAREVQRPPAPRSQTSIYSR